VASRRRAVSRRVGGGVRRDEAQQQPAICCALVLSDALHGAQHAIGVAGRVWATALSMAFLRTRKGATRCAAAS